jgi:hypothetical protein
MDNSRLFGFLLAPVRVLFSGCCFRNELKKSITPSRLGRMLTKKGIDLQYYIYSLPPSDIEQHMSNCKGCNCLDLCVCYLNKKNVYNNFALCFCKSNDSIIKIKNLQDGLYAKNQEF